MAKKSRNLPNCFFDIFTEVEDWHKKNFKFVLGSCLEKIKKILTKILLFLTNLVVNKIIKSKKIADNQVPNVLMFYTRFLSPEVKRWAIITYKDGIYELPHKFPNELRFRIL